MDDFGAARSAQMARVAAALRSAAKAGAEAYANGIAGQKPIVDQHFTAGNQSRYGWAALSRAYFLSKQAGLKGKTKNGVFQPGGGKTGSRLDKNAGFQSSTGTMMGIGSGTNKPMLVNSGDLRAAVSSGGHAVTSNGDSVTIRFTGLPDYALYLNEGTDRMPQRSPVEPNELDRIEIVNAMRRHVDASMGTGGKVAVPRGTVPGKARMA